MKNVTNQKLKTLWRKKSQPLIPKKVKNKVDIKPSTGNKQENITWKYSFEISINSGLIISIFLIYMIYLLLFD